ncbi:response regulator [Pedobacter yulinensis]|uniref:Response regulator n=1 Tax=Pedobacter yulinensis TaxID=2126353 RepID=A0A2T3HSC8_9SPHI|nr:response regulator [Pedobacter yulinensis]PST85311.1 response regulator [Pedobacter yulinensis]
MEKQKILIIDDDSRNIFALKAVLKAKGYSCVSALSAAEGLDMLSAGGIAVVLLDMMMPEMDGYEALSRIRKSDEMAAVPVIAVTAQAMVGDRERCLDAGADAYISKPINVEDLMNLLKQYTV